MTRHFPARLRAHRPLGAIVAALAILLATLVPATASSGADAYDSLRSRVVDYLTGGAASSSTDTDISARVAAIDATANGFWSTMDTTATRSYLWADTATTVNRHSVSYGRLSAMALAYSTPGSSLYHDVSLLADTVSGLDWVTGNWYNPAVQRDSSSWYYSEVSAPTNLLNAATLLYSQLTSAQLASYLAAADHFVPTPRGFTGDYVAANRVWKAYVVLLSGILAKSSTKLDLARDAMSQVLLYVGTSDGFYVDGSFIQHAWYPYAGSYGTSLISSLASLLYVLKGSSWDVTDTNISHVSEWVYNTFEPIVFDGVLMDAFRGRENSRYQNQDVDAGVTLIGAIATVARVAPSSSTARLTSMVKALVQQADASKLYASMSVATIDYVKGLLADSAVTAREDLVKNVRYPAEDRVVHLRSGWAFTLGLHSSHTKNYEQINGENKHGWFTADGMTYLYTDDDPTAFSDDYWATVNPYRLPGTTTQQTTVADSSGVSTPWSTTMHETGGASIDGQYGVEAMYLDAEQTALQAKKAWFMFDDEVVSLGAGVASTDSAEVDTTIENRKLTAAGDNAFQVDGVATSTALAAATSYSAVTSLYLAGTGGYYFPTPTTVQSHRYARSGQWSDINDNYTDGQTHTNNFMELWIDHGTAPSAQKYAYVTLPNATAAQTTAYAANPDVTVLENSTTAMAVKDDSIGTAGYIFWNDESHTVNGVTSDKKAAIMTKSSSGSLEVTVTDPTQDNTGSISVEIASPAASVASLPSNVTVTQLTPTLKFTVDVANTHGRDTTMTFRTTATGSTTTTDAPNSWPASAAAPVADGDFQDATAIGALPSGWSATTNGMGSVGEAAYTNSGNWFAKSVKFTKTATGYGMYLRRSFAATSPTVNAAAYVTAAQSNQNWRMILKSGSTEAVKITFGAGGSIMANDSTTVMPYSANVPYLVEIKVNTTSDTFDLYVDSVKRLAGAPLKSAVSSIDGQEFSAYSADTGTIYVDEAVVYDYDYAN